MEFIEYSHRHAKAIIEADEKLANRYAQFTETLRSITDEELIEDFCKRKKDHKKKRTAFKSLTPSINGILKSRLLQIEGWKAEVDIFNDRKAIGNTEWRLDFACDDAFCVEIAFNHGEAIAWNLLKPVLACELNHVEKAVQGQVGIYVCATENMKIAANIDPASGAYEKVLRYLKPMMNQLTIPMMIIGLKPFETFKIQKTTEIVCSTSKLPENLCDRKVLVTSKDDYSLYKGTVVECGVMMDGEPYIAIQKSRCDKKIFRKRMIKFLEVEEEIN